MPQLYQVIFQAPTLTELDGLVTLFPHYMFKAQQLRIPSFKQRFNNSAHSYSGLQIAGKVPIHDIIENNSNPSPDDSQAKVITYQMN